MEMIADVITNNKLKAQAVYGIFPARGVEDDFEITHDNEIFKFFSLRQQEIVAIDRPSLALGDFVSPKEDYVGAFAVTAGIGCDEMAAEFEANHDDYKSIMIKAVADRFAEAFAEFLH